MGVGQGTSIALARYERLLSIALARYQRLLSPLSPLLGLPVCLCVCVPRGYTAARRLVSGRAVAEGL